MSFKLTFTVLLFIISLEVYFVLIKRRYFLSKEQRKEYSLLLIIVTNIIATIICDILIPSSIALQDISSYFMKTFEKEEKQIELDNKQEYEYTNSANTEPIFNISIDRNKDKLSISHETHEMYKIKYVIFAKVRTIAIMKYSSEDMSSFEIQEKYGEMPLTKGRSENVGGCSEEEAERYNKKLEVSLDIDWMNEKIPKIDKLEKKVKKECKNRKDIHYWGVSPDFNYYYFEIVYSDVHGNLNSVYYVYKKEYMTDWKTYKITRGESQRYTENILYEYNGTKREDNRIIKELFSDKNFIKFEDSKYDQYWEWFNLRQFE